MRSSMAASLRGRLERFGQDRRGNVAIIFALCMLAIVMIAGGAFDYSSSIRTKTTLDAAADSSALMAARTAAEQFRANASNWNALGVAAGQQAFQANVSTSLHGLNLPAPTIAIVKTGQVIAATVAYSGQVATSFLKVANLQTIRIGNSVTSKVTVASYTDLHIVIYVSTSMGMAATLADQTAIQTALGTNCFVACHIDAFPGADNVASYRAAGATLRIDVLKQSVIQALQTLQATSAAGTIRVALYTFHNTLTQVSGLSTDLAAAIAKVATIDLTTVGGGTNITYALQTLNPLLPTPGAGTSSFAPKGAVLLFTDGLQDHETYTPATGWTNDLNWVPYAPSVYNGWDYQPIDPGPCAPIKTKGYSFLVLNVQYIISASDLALQTRYADIANIVMPALPAAILACSSGASYAYSANSPTQINNAVAAMFASAANSLPRLSN